MFEKESHSHSQNYCTLLGLAGYPKYDYDYDGDADKVWLPRTLNIGCTVEVHLGKELPTRHSNFNARCRLCIVLYACRLT